jgi:hypothetical protein
MQDHLLAVVHELLGSLDAGASPVGIDIAPRQAVDVFIGRCPGLQLNSCNVLL